MPLFEIRSATANGTVSIWNVSTGSCVQRFDRVHRQIIRTLSFSDDGKFLASGGFDNHINLWEMKVSVTAAIKFKRIKFVLSLFCV